MRNFPAIGAELNKQARTNSEIIFIVGHNVLMKWKISWFGLKNLFCIPGHVRLQGSFVAGVIRNLD